MAPRLEIVGEKLRTGLWPVPLAMLLLSGLLFAATHALDDQMAEQPSSRFGWWLYGGSGDDARNLLSTLVTAIITMSSIVFSITVVALTLAASQFGSRLVRTFMADLRTQLSLGTFITTVTFCLLALRAVQADMPDEQVPQITVTVALLLGLVSVLTLLFHLHHVSRSIIADEVIRRVASDLERSVHHLPSIDGPTPGEDASLDKPPEASPQAWTLASREEGYVQAVDHPALVALADRHGLVLHLGVKAGSYVCRHGWLASVWPPDALTPDLSKDIGETIVIGSARTPTQDLEFSLRHLVDIALRALSPSINDANTALVVIDRLRGALSDLLGKALPSAVHRAGDGRVCVVTPVDTHGDVIDAALNQIRQSAASHPSVIIALLRAIGRLAEHVRLPEQREALARHARMIGAAGLQALAEPQDRADIEKAQADALEALNDKPANDRVVIAGEAAAPRRPVPMQEPRRSGVLSTRSR